MASILRLKEVRLDVPDGVGTRTIFDVPNFELEEGAFLGVRGASGSGKSTFLKLISGILLPTTGSIEVGHTIINQLSEVERDRWRGRHIGFLFQDFRLFDGLTALENVLLPFTFHQNTICRELREDAVAKLCAVGVRPGTRAECLSRGEMQRTALVRVLMQSPKIILADEPTASLDTVRGDQAVEVLQEAASSLGATLLLVSPDERVLSHFNQTITLSNGRLFDGEDE